MPLISCPDCNKKISDQSTACPKCGRPINAEVVASANEKVVANAEQRRESMASARDGAIRALTIITVIVLVGSILGVILSTNGIQDAEENIKKFSDYYDRKTQIRNQVQAKYQSQLNEITQNEREASNKSEQSGGRDNMSAIAAASWDDQRTKIGQQIEDEISSQAGLMFGDVDTYEQERDKLTTVRWVSIAALVISSIGVILLIKHTTNNKHRFSKQPHSQND
jgi:predicted nucleic acid-binding Zn ribbon protein